MGITLLSSIKKFGMRIPDPEFLIYPSSDVKHRVTENSTALSFHLHQRIRRRIYLNKKRESCKENEKPRSRTHSQNFLRTRSFPKEKD